MPFITVEPESMKELNIDYDSMVDWINHATITIVQAKNLPSPNKRKNQGVILAEEGDYVLS